MFFDQTDFRQPSSIYVMVGLSTMGYYPSSLDEVILEMQNGGGPETVALLNY